MQTYFKLRLKIISQIRKRLKVAYTRPKNGTVWYSLLVFSSLLPVWRNLYFSLGCISRPIYW